MRKSGSAWHTPHFILSRLEGEADEQKIGFVITKKTFKQAVKRNRIKRRLRALARDILPKEAQKGDYVFIGKPPCLDADPETLKKDVLWALKRLSCLKQP